MKLQRTTSDHPDFQALVHELDQELWNRYPDIQAQYQPLNRIFQNKHVVLAYVEGMPAGCGCFKIAGSQTVEIKRMYVRPSYRGRGVAYAILQELERWATEEKFSVSILETGSKQPEAIGLYQKSGYRLVENFDPYIDMPDSICLRKQLPFQS